MVPLKRTQEIYVHHIQVYIYTYIERGHVEIQRRTYREV